jgi:excisionase family DNA binding protein
MQFRTGAPLRTAPPVLLTVREAATRLRTSKATVYKLCELGQLRSMRVSTNAIRIAEEELVRFLRSCAGRP